MSERAMDRSANLGAPASHGVPVVRLKPGGHRRLVNGHPWIFSNEIEMTEAAKALPAGGLAILESHEGEKLGLFTFNPHPLISARLLSRDPRAVIDADFIARRLAQAEALRARLFDQPFYRLVHAEADGMPGIIIDRFADAFAVQANTAGADRLLPLIRAGLDRLFQPRLVVVRNDSPARALEGLEIDVAVHGAESEAPVALIENGVRFLADLRHGQKTGWFYDQRMNRAFMAGLARGSRVLDLYSYGGGFALAAARGGAVEVIAVDRSQSALALAEQSAALNDLSETCRFVRAEAFGEMARLAEAGERFDMVIADPPAFVKSRKDVNQGAKGYRKMVRLAARLVAPGGYLFAASCSYHVDGALFGEMVRKGVADAGRTGRILLMSGAGPDHPLHPSLPESAYLKAEVLQLD